MKKALLILLSVFAFNCADAQIGLLPGMEVTTYASYSGGQGPMAQFLKKNLKNPTAFPIEDVTVICRVMIDSMGTITNVALSRVEGKTSNKDAYVKEAIRVIRLMPAWNPSTVNGKPATMAVMVPISFKDYVK